MVGRRKFLSKIIAGGMSASLSFLGRFRWHLRDRGHASEQLSSSSAPLDAPELPTGMNLKFGTIWYQIKTQGRSIRGGTAFVPIRNTGTHPLSKIRVALYQHVPSTGYTLLGCRTLTIQPGEVRFPRFNFPESVAKDLAAQRIRLTASCYEFSRTSLGDPSPQKTQQVGKIP